MKDPMISPYTSLEDTSFELLRMIQFALPESEEEIEAFIEEVGSTKVELPDSIANPQKLFLNIHGEDTKN